MGSLPFASLEGARSLLERFRGEVPFLPELPALDPDDALVRRPFAGSLEAGDLGEARLVRPLEGAALVAGPGLAVLREALGGSSPRAVKLQTAGPCVLASWARGPRGARLDPVALAERAGRLAGVLRAGLGRADLGLPGSPPLVVVLDEPGLGGEVAGLARAVSLLRAGGFLVGVHDCGADFRRALAAGPDLVAFDFASFGRDVGRPGDPLAAFVAAGGCLGFGVVSTLPGGARAFVPAAGADAIEAAAVRLAGDGARALLARSLVTPACGTALLPEDEAVLAHEQALAVARILRARAG